MAVQSHRKKRLFIRFAGFFLENYLKQHKEFYLVK